MKNKKILLGIEEVRKIKMTKDEKARIFNKIINTSIETRESIKSPWLVSSSLNSKSYQKMAFYLVFPLVVIFTSGAVAFASQDSLPDDILYPVKVKVIEPLGGALKFKQEAKATYQSSLASLRLSEAETLARQDKLDEKKENKLNNLLLEHTVSFHKAIDKASKVESEEKIEEMAANFRAEMNVHARILDKIIDSKNNEKKSLLGEESFEVEFEKENFEDEEGINEDEGSEDKKEDTNDGETRAYFKISETARLNADKIKEEIIKREKERIKEDDTREFTEEKESQYKKKKESVLLLIEQVNKDIDSVLFEQLKDRKMSEEDVVETLNKAKSYLEEAESRENKGVLEEAYSSLIESEDSLKEINVFLNSRLKIR